MLRILVLFLISAASFANERGLADEKVFEITSYGATPDDQTDDTLAIRAALDACRQAGGGKLLIPAGTFLVSRQKDETPILEIPSKTTVTGVGADSILKYSAKVNETNFWRMLGSSSDCHDIIIEKLHLDGSNSFQEYVKLKTPEQNHGIFFYRKGGRIENVTVRDCLVENFSGDCVSFSQGCRGFRITNITLHNFIRQGIQIGGGPGDGGHRVTDCRDLPHSVKPGGSTIHVEHAEGASDIEITHNICLNSLLAGGGADRLVIRENEVHGRIEGNSIKRGLIEGNRLMAAEAPGKRSLMQFGFADELVIRDNVITAANPEATGIYVWGSSRYNPAPSKKITIEGNSLTLPGQPISLNAVHGAIVRGNTISNSTAPSPIKQTRSQDLTLEESSR